MPDAAPPSSGAPGAATKERVPPAAIAFLGCAGLVFLLLLAAAFSWDCSRMVEAAHAKVSAAVDEQRLQEDRILAAIAAAGISMPELEAAIASYRDAKDIREKDRLFEGVLAGIGRAPRPAASVDDPLARRAADELAGAQNRRLVAMRNRRATEAAYREAASGLRGSIGRSLSGLPERLD